jgi:hypothetical protein
VSSLCGVVKSRIAKAILRVQIDFVLVIGKNLLKQTHISALGSHPQLAIYCNQEKE